MTIGSTNGPVAAAPRPADRARGEHASHIVNCLWTGMLPVPTSRKLELLPHELLDVAGVFSRATLAAGMAPIVP
jgi:hypothetical protein